MMKRPSSSSSPIRMCGGGWSVAPVGDRGRGGQAHMGDLGRQRREYRSQAFVMTQYPKKSQIFCNCVFTLMFKAQ